MARWAAHSSPPEVVGARRNLHARKHPTTVTFEPRERSQGADAVTEIVALLARSRSSPSAIATRSTQLGMWPVWVVALSPGITLGACGAAGQTPVRIATGAAPGTSLRDSPTPSAAVTVTTLTALAQALAAGADDSNVSVGDAVRTTHPAASTATSGAPVDTSHPASLVQLQGHCTALDTAVPSGAKPPTGTDVIFVVDAASGALTDWGVRNRHADRFALGSVIARSAPELAAKRDRRELNEAISTVLQGISRVA